MPYRKNLVSTLWLISAMTLLASVLVAPSRTSGFACASSNLEDLRRSYELCPPGQPTTRLSAAMATDAILEVDALPSEDEEKERPDVLDEPQVSFLMPCSYSKVTDRQSIAPRSLLSHYPLRC